ncbi:hypothetical protein [Burkholderia sp. LMG 32019]|uniref:hypothetical protein n=1 Tax=Burkholderia sp. LMG 32019 TaxID=3158173 RepID=UPI003C2CB597
MPVTFAEGLLVFGIEEPGGIDVCGGNDSRAVGYGPLPQNKSQMYVRMPLAIRKPAG